MIASLPGEKLSISLRRAVVAVRMVAVAMVVVTMALFADHGCALGDDAAWLRGGTLLFEDSFDREEDGNLAKAIGNGWNSATMNLEIQKRRKGYLERKEKLPDDLAALLATKSKSFPWAGDPRRQAARQPPLGGLRPPHEALVQFSHDPVGLDRRCEGLPREVIRGLARAECRGSEETLS